MKKVAQLTKNRSNRVGICKTCEALIANDKNFKM